MQPKVTIIVLNWNNWEDTIECLESLYRINYHNFNVIMVDNGSDDDSAAKIRDYAQGNLEVKSDFFTFNRDNKPLNYVEIEKDKYSKLDLKEDTKTLFILKNDQNYGFAEGNNVGIKFALEHLKPKYIEILNNDIVVAENYLDEMVRIMEESDDIGMVGPKIYFYDYHGRKNVQTALGGYINWKIYPGYNYLQEKIENTEPIELDWVTGASLLIRSDLKDPYLSSDFFFGAEDIDLSLRVKDEGYKIYLAPKAEIWHKISLSRYKKFNSYFKRFKNTINSHFTLVKKHKKAYPLYYILYIVEMVFVYGKRLIKER